MRGISTFQQLNLCDPNARVKESRVSHNEFAQAQMDVINKVFQYKNKQHLLKHQQQQQPLQQTPTVDEN